MSHHHSFRSIAVERYHICQSAAALPSRTLISFDAGLDPRPVKVSLQNVFCDMLNVTVLYPFGGAAMQKALFNAHHPTRCLSALLLCNIFCSFIVSSCQATILTLIITHF